jgi:hypothetical protein
MLVRRFALTVSAAAVMAAVASAGAAQADPPQPPPGCDVVVGTPAAFTGSFEGLSNKVETFNRLCLPHTG